MWKQPCPWPSRWSFRSKWSRASARSSRWSDGLFGSLQGWGKIFHDNMAVIMVKIWGTYGEHEVLSHHCLVVSNFFLCLFFEKAIEMGDSPKTQDPIDLSNSMWESYPCHKPTSFGDGFYMHKMVMTWGWWHWALGFPWFPTLCCQVFPPGFLDAEELQKDFGLWNSEKWPLLVSVSSIIHHSSQLNQTLP